jgi:hypothetical protein
MSDPSQSTIPEAISTELSALARTFPTLRGLQGVSPFDADALARQWAADVERDKDPDVLARDHAISFILGPALCAVALRMANPGAITMSGEAQRVAREWVLEIALGIWDRPHREAFVGWVMSLPYASTGISPVPPDPGISPVPPDPGATGAA